MNLKPALLCGLLGFSTVAGCAAPADEATEGSGSKLSAAAPSTFAAGTYDGRDMTLYLENGPGQTLALVDSGDDFCVGPIQVRVDGEISARDDLLHCSFTLVRRGAGFVVRWPSTNGGVVEDTVTPRAKDHLVGDYGSLDGQLSLRSAGAADSYYLTVRRDGVDLVKNRVVSLPPADAYGSIRSHYTIEGSDAVGTECSLSTVNIAGVTHIRLLPTAQAECPISGRY